MAGKRTRIDDWRRSSAERELERATGWAKQEIHVQSSDQCLFVQMKSTMAWVRERERWWMRIEVVVTA